MQAEFVNESYGEENNKLFFDAQTLMQSGLAETVARAVPHLAPQIEAAAATGGMVEMTRGDFHAFLPQEAQHHLANIARMSPDAFSAAEAAAWEETEAAAEFEETAKRAHADAEAQLARQQEFDGLKARFKQELAATGRMNAQNADDAASVWASHIQSYAGRLNMTPDEFMGRYGRLNVVGESLTREGVFSQALASAPPKGWVHVADGAEAAALWNGTSDAQAVFWDMPQGKLAAQLPEVAGYSFSVSRSAIGHIRKNHGNAEAEASRGLVAVNEADIARIPEMLADYDAVRTDLTATLGNKRIAFAKAFDNGTAVYLADVSRKKRDIQAVSLWKYPAGVDAQTALERAITEEKDKKRELPTSVDEPHSATANHTSETEAGISLFDGDDTTAAPLFQDMTAEQAQFAETEAAYGGREAYEAAKAEGRTELDYRQWVQVRTPAFKEWFGDWENDAANASKVVNPKTGEPLVVYHGTNAEFTVFDNQYTGNNTRNNGYYGYGFYFAAKDRAQGYGNTAMPIFLNIRNPLFNDGDLLKPIARKMGVRYRGYELVENQQPLLIKYLTNNGNRAEAFTQAVRSLGYDGVFSISPDMGIEATISELVALSPNQIKSATANSGAFSADDDSILYQESADLVATHNISEEGILHAAKAGGLPMASLAVAHKDNLLENFGEITLIGDKDLIDPKGANKAKVFGADIYSPRYPGVHYDYDARDLAQVRARFQSAADEIGDASFAYDMTQKPQAEGLPRTLAESAAVRFQFLRDIGAEVEPVYKNARPYSGIPLKALDGFTADMTEEEALHDAKLMRAVAEELSAKMAGKDALKSRYEELQQALADGSFLQNRDLKNIISNFAFARGGIDFQATSRLVGAETAKRQAEFDAYVAEIADSVPVAEKLRVGKTASGGDKFVPHTLENVAKLMKKNLRGGENDFYGLPNLRAKVTPQFKSVAAIKKAKGRLVSNADFQRVVDEIRAEMGKLAQTLGIKSSETEAFLMAVIDENFDTAAKRYGAFAGEKQQQAVAAFLTKLKEMPTEYFEVKAKEITQFSDFKAAVVPESIDEAARKVLEEAGLKLYTYDAATQSRADVVRQAAAETGLLFQDARGMFDRMADTIALLKNADASTFIHEFGHFELETMSRIERDLRGMPPSELSEGERQVLADFQTVLDWFGVKDGDAWAAMTLDGQREHHEKFARGMEAYLFEGKAPSEALRGVFSRVARLLKRIYRTLAGLNVALSDDIREVFGRLLASDEQIAEAEYVNGMKLLLDEDAELRAMDEAARREAQDGLGRRALRDMAFSRNARSREIRRLKREYKADFARAEMDARRSIMKQPVYRAWQLFTAKMTDEDRIDGNSRAEREFRRKAKVLQGKPVYTIEKRTAPQGFKALREWAQDIFDKAGNQAANPEVGTVLLNERSVRDSIAHGMNPFKAEAFQAVPDVIAKGAVVHQGENPENGVRYAYISAPVVIEGKEDIVTVLVRDSGDGGRMYLHSVATKESILNASDTETTEISRETGKVNSGYIANILRSYLKYKPKTDRTALDPSSDTLMAAIAKLGGLNKDEVVREWGLDPKDKIAAPVFGMPVLRRTKGRSIDAMVEVLAEAGYLPVDSHGKADVRDLEERFSDGLSGHDWYSRHYVPRGERKAGEEVANPYALNAVRLDESGLDGLPADWAQVLKERGMTAKTGGMHPDIAAGLILDENGEPVFSDGLDLVQALVEALPPQEAIEDTARLNLLAEKGEVPTQADFEEAADLAVHNEMRARLIAGELNRLKASLGSVSLLKQAARVAAKERVEQMKTRDLRASVFTRAEAVAAKSSEKAFKAGDTEAAAAHKRNQLIQNALARETLKAREEMEKTRRYLAKFDRVAKGVDIEYREQIEALLEDVELRQISLKETDRRKSAYQFVREMEEAGIQHSIDPEYVDTISRKSRRDMTVEEMRGLADTVRQLEHLGRLKNRLPPPCGLALCDKENADFADVLSGLNLKAADLTAGAQYVLPLPVAHKRYLRGYFTVQGTATAGKVDVAIAGGIQTNNPPPESANVWGSRK